MEKGLTQDIEVQAGSKKSDMPAVKARQSPFCIMKNGSTAIKLVTQALDLSAGQ